MTKPRILSQAFILLIFVSVTLFSCSDSGTSANNQENLPQTTEQIPDDTGVNILTSVFPSPKEQNPYSVENMNKTFKNLILANNANAKNIPELEANFLYVRFLPYGKQGVYELKTYDTSLALFKHPMDYNEIRKPVVYIDKNLPDSIIPYFAAVPVGYEFGPTPYEILQELFLTQPLEEDDEDDYGDSRFAKARRANQSNKDIAAYLKNEDLKPSQLEMAAFPNSERFNVETENRSNKILAKNTPDNIDNIVAWSLFSAILPDRWRPSGTLKYYDEQLKDMPLVGVRVTAGYFYYWRSSTTDSNGYFQNPERWTFSVDYEANFDSDQFLLEDGHSWYGEDLEIEKNNKKSAWNETFSGNHAKWCVVWTAAWNYWYGKIYGLKKPRQNEWWNQSLDIWVYYKNDEDYNEDIGSSSNGNYGYNPFTERIAIRAHKRSHIEIYGSTIHEIAHSSHYWNVQAIFGINIATYALLPEKLKESYATGIQRYLTNKRYGNDAWSRIYNSEYTGIFEDLEDTNSTYEKFNDFEKHCDKVSGITAPMVEEAVFNSFYWEHFFWDNFKDNLKKRLKEYYQSGTINEDGIKISYTSADIDALFEYWTTGTGSPCPEQIIDTRDGKVYKTTTIGTQTWMTENLNYSASGSVCYGNVTANCEIYGRLYDWATAIAVCPSGWHLPSVKDWNTLMHYVDNTKNGSTSPYDSRTAGKYLKATSGWKGYYNDNSSGYGNGNGIDYYGFAALPGGCYSGSFKNLGNNGDWWSASEYDSSSAYRFDLYGGDKAGWEDYEGNRKHNKSSLFSVRCVKD